MSYNRNLSEIFKFSKKIFIHTGKILGLEYTGALQFGRGPTKNSGGSGPTLRERIEQWIQDKRIISDISVRSLSYAIANKIHAEGTKSFPQGTDLIDSVITPERIDEIVDKVGLLYVDVIVKGLVAELEKLAVAA